MVNTDVLHGGQLRVDLGSRDFYVAGRKVLLRRKEIDLICFLIENAGRVLSRAEILEEVWDRNIFCPTNTVDVHVCSLRRKLKRYNRFAQIKTVHCIGYIFQLK